MTNRKNRKLKSELDLADRLGSTHGDRKLEAAVLIELGRSMSGTKGPRISNEAELVPARNTETDKDGSTIYDNAVSIAGFLATRYAAASLEQKKFIAAMACEVAQRFAEDFPG